MPLLALLLLFYSLELFIINTHSHRETYKESHCYQYDIRLKNIETDLKEADLTRDEVSALRVKDFEFRFVPKEDKESCHQIRAFIERHEWLGKMPHRPTHRFIASYRGHLAGVVIMATPNAFSDLLGKDKRNLEKLISRGACISWSPKNLGSALVMFAVRWMARNTEFRFFTAYSDTEARELGTIYQACNFTYLGTTFGARAEYFDPVHPERGWFSDRLFRKPSAYRRSAATLGIGWQPEWSNGRKINWPAIPVATQNQLRAEARRVESACQRRGVPKKHKYVYIVGRTKPETMRLREVFRKQHPELAERKYPKTRGPASDVVIPAQPQSSTAPDQRPTNFAATAPEKISDGHLNLQKSEIRPRGHENVGSPEAQTICLTIKEIASRYGISDWTLYRFIKTDPTFPYLNVGLKKKFVINEVAFRTWMEERTKRQRNQFFSLPTGEELLTRRTG